MEAGRWRNKKNHQKKLKREHSTPHLSGGYLMTNLLFRFLDTCTMEFKILPYLTLSDLELNLSRLIKVKPKTAAGYSIYDFLLVC